MSTHLCNLGVLEHERSPKIGIESSSNFPGTPGIKIWVKIWHASLTYQKFAAALATVQPNFVHSILFYLLKDIAYTSIILVAIGVCFEMVSSYAACLLLHLSLSLEAISYG